MTPVDRDRVPEAGPIRAFDFPAVEVLDTSSGMDLRIARESRLPVVSVNLFMRAGESDLAERNAGLAVLAGDALEGGSRRRSGSDLAEALERIGARMSVRTGWEGTSVSLSCLAERLPEGLSILAETVLEPDFPAEEVDRAREQALAAVRQRAMDPASIASDRAARRCFADGVPYARPIDGTEQSVSPLSREHVRGFADAYFKPASGGLVVVGDVAADEIEGMVAESFGSWSGGPPEREEFEVLPQSRSCRVLVVDRPGSVQSEIRVGHVGVARSHPDEYAISVVNTLFGGAFTSRLNLNLREQNGFTYGVRSRFLLRSRGGLFQVGTAVGTDVTADAVREIMSEMRRLVADGATETEVEAARDYIAGVFPLRLETVGQIAARIGELIVYDLPEDYHHTYRDRIRAVSVESASAVAARHIRPDEAQVVVVGHADEVVPGLEGLGLGPVEVVSAAD